MFHRSSSNPPRVPWNKGKLIGQKLPLSMQEIWTVRMRLQSNGNLRDLALFNLAIDSKLRACDLLSLRISDVANGKEVQSRAIIRQRNSPHLSLRQYTRIVESWVSSIGLDPTAYGTHSMRRTKATVIYRRTKSLRAVQLLWGTQILIARYATWGLK